MIVRTKVILFIVAGLIIALAGGGIGGYFLGQNAKQQAVRQASESAREATLKELDEKSKAGNPQTNSSVKTEAGIPCNADEIAVSVAPEGDGARGSVGYMLLLKNSGTRTCTLGGYPGVSLVNSAGILVGQPAKKADGYLEKLLTLTPGKSVGAILHIAQAAQYGAGVCKNDAAKLRLYPPNDTGYVSIPTPVATWCPGMTISPVVNL